MKLRRKREEHPATELDRLITGVAPFDIGQLVRALSRAVVHVPLPGAEEQAHPRLVRSADGPPLYVLEDSDGIHALAYTSAARLVEAWGSGTTAASTSMAGLLASWQSGVDLVLNAGLASAYVLSEGVLDAAALDAAGVPTAAATLPSPAGVDLALPDAEPIQIIGATREVANVTNEIVGLWRAMATDREPTARPILTVVVELVTATEERLDRVATELRNAISAVDPQPVRLIPIGPAEVSSRHDELATRIRELDDPYWSRSVV